MSGQQKLRQTFTFGAILPHPTGRHSQRLPRVRFQAVLVAFAGLWGRNIQHFFQCRYNYPVVHKHEGRASNSSRFGFKAFHAFPKPPTVQTGYFFLNSGHTDSRKSIKNPLFYLISGNKSKVIQPCRPQSVRKFTNKLTSGYNLWSQPHSIRGNVLYNNGSRMAAA